MYCDVLVMLFRIDVLDLKCVDGTFDGSVLIFDLSTCFAVCPTSGFDVNLTGTSSHGESEKRYAYALYSLSQVTFDR